jgi:hypothetical protein
LAPRSPSASRSQLQGTKRWTVFAPGHALHLYKNASTSTFEVDPDAAKDAENLRRFPLSAFAKGVQCDVAPGDIIFVPAGTAHAVTNLDRTLGLAGNLIDESNLEYALERMELEGGFQRECAPLAPGAPVMGGECSAHRFSGLQLYRHLKSAALDTRVDFGVGNTPWAQVKRSHRAREKRSFSEVTFSPGER